MNKWVLVVYMLDGSKRWIGPFATRSLAQQYGARVEGAASYEAENLIRPFQ